MEREEYSDVFFRRFGTAASAVHSNVDVPTQNCTRRCRARPVRQGRTENGDNYLYDQNPFEPEGWVTIRVVNDGTHSRVYAGKTMLAHGHGTAPTGGPVGIRLNGTGTALLDFMKVQTLR